jgi:RNA polymerase sigma-70 factor (ECF subfamily)
MTDLAEAKLKQVLREAAAGDAQAWRQLVTAFTPRIFGLLVKQCGDRDLAEEITQATFVRIVDKLGDYEEQGRFEPWLFRIAMNRLRDEMRRRKRQAKPMSALAGPGGEADDPMATMVAAGEDQPLDRMQRDEQIVQLRRAIAQLAEADQQILELRHAGGLSFAQIAETLEQPLGTVLARGHRAIGKLRKLMEADESAD